MVAYTKPQYRWKENERLRGERDQIKFIDLKIQVKTADHTSCKQEFSNWVLK